MCLLCVVGADHPLQGPVYRRDHLVRPHHRVPALLRPAPGVTPGLVQHQEVGGGADHADQGHQRHQHHRDDGEVVTSNAHLITGT